MQVISTHDISTTIVKLVSLREEGKTVVTAVAQLGMPHRDNARELEIREHGHYSLKYPHGD